MFEGSTQEATAGPGTVVGANVKLTGTISDVNDITIHGVVEGEVVSDKTVTITETATVKGPITAQLVSVSGRVNGAVTAKQKLELLPSARVSGSINTTELIIKSGAKLNGKCVMAEGGDEASAPAGMTEKATFPAAKKRDKAESADQEEAPAPEKLPAEREPMAVGQGVELEE
ncbi:polymer-forming cytoskeletal protein [Candidatus Berkelbacteria bacterium]|nr:polymer-forming cytoskeletal protein [Candidatus Berkelbacteria bacterium]